MKSSRWKWMKDHIIYIYQIYHCSWCQFRSNLVCNCFHFLTFSSISLSRIYYNTSLPLLSTFSVRELKVSVFMVRDLKPHSPSLRGAKHYFDCSQSSESFKCFSVPSNSLMPLISLLLAPGIIWIRHRVRERYFNDWTTEIALLTLQREFLNGGVRNFATPSPSPTHTHTFHTPVILLQINISVFNRKTKT
jgi:hypothetical protein